MHTTPAHKSSRESHWSSHGQIHPLPHRSVTDRITPVDQPFLKGRFQAFQPSFGVRQNQRLIRRTRQWIQSSRAIATRSGRLVTDTCCSCAGGKPRARAGGDSCFVTSIVNWSCADSTRTNPKHRSAITATSNFNPSMCPRRDRSAYRR